MFGGVRYVGFDASGNLYIVDGLGSGQVSSGDLEGAMRRFRAMLDSDGLRVLVFDASGDFVREFGSGGEGPGEFKTPMGFAVMRHLGEDLHHQSRDSLRPACIPSCNATGFGGRRAANRHRDRSLATSAW